MSIPPVAARALALLGGYAAASIVVYALREELLSSLLPAIGWIVDLLLPDPLARTALGVAHVGNEELIALELSLTAPLQTASQLVPTGESLNATTLVAYALQHTALAFAVAVAWPARSKLHRVTLIAAAVPTAIVATLLDIPFVLAGLIHDLLRDVGAEASQSLALYYQFLHRGGRAGLSIALAVGVCLSLGQRAQPTAENAGGLRQIEREPRLER